MHPKQILETVIPVLPNLVYCIASDSLTPFRSRSSRSREWRIHRTPAASSPMSERRVEFSRSGLRAFTERYAETSQFLQRGGPRTHNLTSFMREQPLLFLN